MTLAEFVQLLRAAAVLAGMACIAAWWVASDTVMEQIAWGVLATALFAFVIALRDDTVHS